MVSLMKGVLNQRAAEQLVIQ